MHIDTAIPSQAYGYTMDMPDQKFIVEYRLEKKSDKQTVLMYTEENIPKSSKVKANNKFGELALGWLRKRKFKKMAQKMAQEYYK